MELVESILQTERLLNYHGGVIIKQEHMLIPSVVNVVLFIGICFKFLDLFH